VKACRVCSENTENRKAGFCHVSLKHETAVAKDVIWSSTMSRSRRKGAILRERARLADFNDGRPFVLSSAGIAAGQELTQWWPPSAPGFTDPLLEYP
jgi:hypothetical protein